ncbi:MAG: DUF3106 domain-containing protein [Verrucomicrobia subdivision 3 bacterium]|nr:DUF3106 domain-containing protein [Limisphaerales bacterium]
MNLSRIVFIFGLMGCAAAWSAEPKRLQQPPAPPSSPIEHFRQILALSPEGRESALANRSNDVRRFVLVKLKEFDALSPEEREKRLSTLEFRWHMLALMRGGLTNRAARLHLVPERYRPLVEERLRHWDTLTTEDQRDVLESEPAITIFTSARTGAPSQAGPLSMITTQQQARIHRSALYLSVQPPEKQEKIYRNFDRFFELSEKEKTEALHTLSEAERQRMERSLQAFERLSKSDREQCIAGMRKFALLSPAERDQFLRNAERWQAMSPKDREIWRNLVNRKAFPPPPLPPGADLGRPASRDSSLAQTNRH